MARFILQRSLVLIATLFLVSLLAFLVPYLSAEDPARAIIRARVAELAIDPADVARLSAELGLDRPMIVQYGDWLLGAIKGDFGYSFASKLPVIDQIGRALLVSATIAITALMTALAIALPLGTVAALRPGGRLDSVVTFLAQSFVAVPEYWLAPVSILVFSVWLGWLPSAGWNGPASLVLPALALSLRPLAYFTQVMRASMIEVLRAPYITAARARGLAMGQAVVRHGLRNGVLPVLTLFALWLAGLLGGSVVIEVIFALPGMGRLVYTAVINKDVPMLQGSLVSIVGLAIVINTAADLAYGALNPRVRVAGPANA